MSLKRRRFSKEFKTKVVLESLKERQPLEVLAKKHELLPGQITTWKAIALKNFGIVFSTDSPDKKENGVDSQVLYAQIGLLKVENDWLKKSCNDQF